MQEQIQERKEERQGLFPVFLVLLYAYNVSLVNYLYGSNFNGVVTLLFAACLIELLTLLRTGIFFDWNAFLWGSFFILSCFNNQEIKNNNLASWLTLFVGVVLLCCLKYARGWADGCIRTFAVFSLIHIAATIFLFLAPGVYYGAVIKLFDPSLRPFLDELYRNHWMAGITDHYSTNGIYLAIAFLLFACRIFDQGAYLKYRLRYNILILLSLFALLLTGKRAHLLFGLFAVFLVYLVNNNKHGLASILKISGIVLFAGLLLFILSFFVPAVLNTFNRINEIFQGGDITNGRMEFYTLAYSMFLQHPLLGNGWGSFMYTYQKLHGAYAGVYSLMSAHNVYLQVLCETGILGLSVFLACIFYNLSKTLSALYHLYRDESSDYTDFEKYCLSFSACMQVFFILYCLTGNPLYDAQILLPYMVSCAMSSHIRFQKNRNARKKQPQRSRYIKEGFDRQWSAF